jgi:threonine dehydrogenase-like Zn-dependent dehydrogenase
MRATIMYKAGDVRIESVPDAQLVDPTDAIIRVSRACICGSDSGRTSCSIPSPAVGPWDTKRLA